MPYKHGRKTKMMPVVAYAAGHAVRHVAKHGIKRAAAYIAGGAAAGAGGGTYARKKTHAKRSSRSSGPDPGTGVEFSKVSYAFGRPCKARLPAVVRANLLTTVCMLMFI